MKKVVLILSILFAVVRNSNAQYSVSSIPYTPYAFNTGTPVLVNLDDVWSQAITLPFNFIFYGVSYNQIVIGANGVVSFGPANSGLFCPWSFTASCPNSSIVIGSTGPYIFGAFEDIDPSVYGNIYYKTYGTAPNREFVINFDSIAMFSCNSTFATSQIVLYETTNNIDIVVHEKPLCTQWNSGNAVIGIQDSTGTLGLTPPGRNTGQWTATNEAWRFQVAPLGVFVSNVTNSNCNSSNGAVSINIINNSATPPFTFLWNTTPPQTTQNISNVPPGNYCVTVVDNASDSVITCVTVDTIYFAAPDICIVTTDTTTGYNVVVWNKPVTTGINKYLIYRETTVSGVYALIGTNNYSNLSIFVDSTAIPAQQPYRYELALLDNCGDTSQTSAYHQTIHLAISPAISGGWNLIWNDYIGFSYGSYYIYRGTSNGNLILLDSVSSTVTSYTDLTPPSGTVYYVVEVKPAVPCNPSSKTPTDFSTTLSNKAFSGIGGIQETSTQNSIHIYPNPASDIITIENTALSKGAMISICNIEGQILIQQYMQQSKTTLDISSFAKGMYFVKIKSDKGIVVKKFVKE